MKTLLNNHPNLSIYLGIIYMIALILILIVSFINKFYYKKIAKLYIDRYGSLPITASMAKYASLIASPGAYHAKIGFIMDSLILPYNRFSNHDMTKEQYRYINKLPIKLTIWFRVEGVLWIISIPTLAMALIISVMK
ncbi:TPA: hypothetical protein MYR17_002677 [Citrobacter koseri]|nr:hypothetical protein [Citrobacter koseri]HEJ0181589.1 hypothetical protein [Citrobacter koseri]